MKIKKIMATLIVFAMVLSTMVVLNNLTDFKIVEKAGAQPGVDVWGNATIDLEYGETYADGAVKINTSKWWANDTYFLYYPTYVCSGTGPNADSFAWAGPYSPNGYNVRVAATQAGVAGSKTFNALDTSGATLSFNRSGYWIFDNNSNHNATVGMNGSDPAGYAGYIWVNTSSSAYAISIAGGNNFDYGASGTITITVDTGTDSGCMISILNPDNTTMYHSYRSTGDKSFGIVGNFTMAGDYTVMAYKDLDNDPEQYIYADGETNYGAYNGSYGSGGSFPADASYNYANTGAFDPPEKNATTETITANTGKPIVDIVPDDNETVYWGYSSRIDVNVTDDDGKGITGGTVRIKKSTSTTYLASEVWINESSPANGNYSIEIPKANWTNLGANANGTWYVYFSQDVAGDATEEWNGTAKFSVKSTSPPVRITLLTYTDKKVDVPAYTGGLAGPANTVNISFRILGRSPTGDKEWYGDQAWENEKNITIFGDILYPNDAKHGAKHIAGGGDWYVLVTPTKPGGTITIEIDWPGSDNGTASETLNIINGTYVTTDIDKFTIGQHVNITVTVSSGYPQEHANVTLFWKAGGAINSTAGKTTGVPGFGKDGKYTFWIKPSEQGATAPKNITIAANTPGITPARWGYTSVLMEKNHDMIVNCTPTSSYAGNDTQYDIDVSLVEGGDPATAGLTVALYNETGALVTNVDDAWSKSGAYDINDETIILTAGTYQIHAYNATHDSSGHNATITITAYSVVSSPTVLAWLIDTNTTLTFQVTPSWTGLGLLTLNNMTSTPNGSYVGQTETVEIESGIGTLEGVNATNLGNITYEFTPDGGESRPADGLLRITTATATPTPATLYLNEATLITIKLTHPATGDSIKSGVRVGLDHGINLTTSLLSKLPSDEFTDANGEVEFSVTAEASGDVTIYIMNGTDPDNPFVIKAAVRKTMTLETDEPSVEEGGTFTVTALYNGEPITDETVTITFAGDTYTTDTGTLTLTAPDVTETVDYNVKATAEGYSNAQTYMKVLNVPRLYITISGKADSEGKYPSPVTVIVSDDMGNLITGAIVTFDTQTDTTINGQATFTVDQEKTVTITATMTGFQTGEKTITAKPAGIPGFELLTLIAAIGVAFILLRRRRH